MLARLPPLERDRAKKNGSTGRHPLPQIGGVDAGKAGGRLEQCQKPMSEASSGRMDTFLALREGRDASDSLFGGFGFLVSG